MRATMSTQLSTDVTVSFLNWRAAHNSARPGCQSKFDKCQSLNVAYGRRSSKALIIA